MNAIKVVIADDDGITRHLLRTLLRQQNYEVAGEAINGAEALELCARHRPNVLFLDINMPKMNGFDALRSIRRAHPGIAVIMISSDPTLRNVEEARVYGINEFIVKPFNAAQVVTAITRSQT
jgi:two-component system chemotaxis response regulator CheY